MAFEPGQSGNPNGRPKGRRNRFTQIKQDFLEVFEKIGGSEELAAWVQKDPKNQETFYRMIAQLLPKDTNVNLDTGFTADDRAVQAASDFFAAALGNGPESGSDSQSDALPH